MQKSVPLLAVAFILGSIFTPAGAAADASGTVEARIARIEHGLLARTVIKGRPPATMNLAERMRFHKVPGLSIAVIHNGAIEWARGYGVADSVSGAAVTTDTMFQAASISKPVAAMAALSLVEKGQLTLDADVNTRLVSWKLPDSEFTRDKKVSLRTLLSHSGGTTVHGFRGYAAAEPVPTVVQLLGGSKPANSQAVVVDAIPGSQWRYSGGGFTVAQLMMTDVTQQPFAQLMQSSVLEPLGMRHSTYAQPLPPHLQRVAASAHDSAGVAIKGRWHTYPEQAAAGLWTTPSDLARFAIEIQKSSAGTSDKVLSRAMTAQMLTKTAGDFGLGIEVDGSGNQASFSHGGTNEGFRTSLFAYTSTGQGAVIMTNGDNGANLIGELMRSISREYGWSEYQAIEKAVAQVNPDIYKAYVGEYAVGRGQAFVSVDAGRLLIQAAPLGPAPIEILPQTERSYFMIDSDFSIDFDKDQAGEVTARVRFGGRMIDAKKIK